MNESASTGCIQQYADLVNLTKKNAHFLLGLKLVIDEH